MANCVLRVQKYHQGFSRSPGLLVMGGDSCSEGHGIKSQHRLMNGHFSQKEVGNCPFKNIIKDMFGLQSIVLRFKSRRLLASFLIIFIFSTQLVFDTVDSTNKLSR